MTSKVTDTFAQTQNQETNNDAASSTSPQQSQQQQSGDPFASSNKDGSGSNSLSVEVVPVEVVSEAEDAPTKAMLEAEAKADANPKPDVKEVETSNVKEDVNEEEAEAPQDVSAIEDEKIQSEKAKRAKAKAKFTAKPKPKTEEEPTADSSATEDSTTNEPVSVESKQTDVDPFKALGLREDVYKAIKGFGYETPTAIQKETVSVILEGRDVIGQAETGSGKTAAFAWPLLSQIDLKVKNPQILVLAPTRELALQVTAAFEKYGSSMKGLKCVTVYGGQSYDTQFRSLDRGVHVVVGTPGRIMDHINRKTLKLDQVKTFVLDEADEMLRMGFIDDVQWVMERLPEVRQTLSFSATMPAPIRNIAKKYLKDPAHITIKSKTGTAESIEQSFVVVNFREKLNTLCRLLETEETDGVIVFVKTRQTTTVVAEQLIQRGFDTAALNGDIAQNQRERTVNRLKAGQIDIVVATDVAARGLDVKRVSHVINYDFPHDTETYVHRIGRTGRAGRDGKAVLFVEPKEKRKLGWLEKDTKQKIKPFKSRSIAEINEIRVEKFKQQVIEAANDKQMDFFRELVKTMVEENPHSLETFSAALAVLAQGATPLLLTDKPTGARPERKHLSDADKATYRVEVGRSHGAGPGNIVGAIANEGGMQSGEIGKIKMFDRHSFIDLPSGLSADVMDILRNVSVSGQRLQISLSTGSSHGGSDRSSGGSDRGARRRSNNGSTDFGKRQRPFKGRNSISRSEGFGSSKPSSYKSSSYKGKSEGSSDSKDKQQCSYWKQQPQAKSNGDEGSFFKVI